jgi:hypothetical protein
MGKSTTRILMGFEDARPSQDPMLVCEAQFEFYDRVIGSGWYSSKPDELMICRRFG